jgi:transposase
MDTHCQFCELVAMTERGRVVRRDRCATNIPALVEAIDQVPRPRFLTIEEGPLADWLYRNLVDRVDEMVVCEPRRNHLIAKDSDKDDPIDAEKLAHLYRGGFIKRVHHPESVERVVLKRHTALYYDRVRQRVREANRIMSEFRRSGVFIREREFADAADRRTLLRRLLSPILSKDIELLWKSYDVVSEQVETLREQLIRLGRKEPQVRRFTEIPGVAWIRGVTFLVYMDTPWRFRSKQALWRYVGIGLERRHSGNAPEYVCVAQDANHVLKSTILGAAKSAIAAGDNPFAKQYERWIADGIGPRNARRNVARSLATTLWGMWKNGGAYRPQWVGVAAAAQLARAS